MGSTTLVKCYTTLGGVFYRLVKSVLKKMLSERPFLLACRQIVTILTHMATLGHVYSPPTWAYPLPTNDRGFIGGTPEGNPALQWDPLLTT